MNLIQKLTEEAKAAPARRVAMPECEAVKTLQAARRVADDGIGTPVLVSPADVISATAEEAGVSLEGMEVVDTTDADALEERAARFMAAGQRMLSDKGIRRKMKMPMWYAMVMEELGEVDCTFCGHTNTTGDVLMCAQMTIGLAEGVDVPSILALVDTPGFEGPEGSVICFTDCGLNPEPNASELASIAISAADGVRSIMGWEPRVGFLSFSTDGSGAGQSVDRVDEAIKLRGAREAPRAGRRRRVPARRRHRPCRAAKKVGRESDVAGPPTCWSSRTNAANIAVKLIQRFAMGAAYGHTLNGFKRPVADPNRAPPSRRSWATSRCSSSPPASASRPDAARHHALHQKGNHGIQGPHALPRLHLHQGGRLRRHRGALPPERHPPRRRARPL